jgi:hypothetical protein
MGFEIAVRRLSLLAAFVACVLGCGCGDSCDYAVVSETKSPDGKLKAVVFHRGCGSNPIDSSEQISILSSSASSPSGRGNVFITGDEDHASPVNAQPALEIKVTWQSSTSLSIAYPKNAQVILKRSSVAGVTVNYQVTP